MQKLGKWVVVTSHEDRTLLAADFDQYLTDAISIHVDERPPLFHLLVRAEVVQVDIRLSYGLIEGDTGVSALGDIWIGGGCLKPALFCTVVAWRSLFQ